MTDKLACCQCKRNQPSGLWYDKKTMRLAGVCAACGFKYAPQYLLLKNFDAGQPAAQPAPKTPDERLLPDGHRVPMRLHPTTAMAIIRCITHDQSEVKS